MSKGTLHWYFVAWRGKEADGNQSFGNIEMGMKAPITTMAAIREIEAAIRRDSPSLTNVIVNGFQLLRTEPAPTH